MFWLLIVLIVVPPAILLSLRYLQLRRDFIPLTIYLQYIVYLQIAPYIYLKTYMAGEDDGNYYELMWASALFFELPFWIIYVFLFKIDLSFWIKTRRRYVTKKSEYWAFTYTLILAIAFIFVVFRRNLGFMWYGNEENTRIISSLPVLDWIVFRGYMQSALLIALSWFLFNKHKQISRFELIASAIAFLPWLIWSSINSRSNVVVAAVFVTAILVRKTISIKSLGRIALVAIGACYCMMVVLSARAEWSEQGDLSWSVLKPTAGNATSGPSSLTQRLNGIDAMALMKDGIDANGPAWGEAWIKPLWFAVSQPFRRLAGLDPKEFVGSTKVILLKEYASIDVPDYASCLLTDAYGNLGYLGFLMISILSAVACAIGTKGWTAEGTVPAAFGLFLFYNIFTFESDVISLAYGWLRTAIFIVPFWAILFKRRRVIRPLTPAIQCSHRFTHKLTTVEH